jgi:hypothetical protein
MFHMHPREILFGSQRALLTNVAEYGDLAEASSTLGLNPPQPVLVIVGGASGMTAGELVKTKELFDNVLVPYADLHQIAIMDGGTDAGVMQAIGDARSNHNATFPLIGIVIEKGIGATILENGQFPSSILEPNHTHFILTPGENWDDTASWISAAAGAFSGNAPALTILFNGGEIAWEDAAESVSAGRPVIVAEGSGRTADAIAKTSTGRVIDKRAVALLKTGLITIINPFERPDFLLDLLNDYFKPSDI